MGVGGGGTSLRQAASAAMAINTPVISCANRGFMAAPAA
jgi:hypothetical protein